MRVLGIDPGTANTGYGVVASAPGRLTALASGVIETSSRAPLERRLADIHLFFGSNARSAFAVGQARGVVLLAAGQRAIPCASYTPQQVKGAVCGSGRAGKEQVGRMVQALLRLTEMPKADHTSDALAVAVCHVNRAPLQARLQKAMSE